MNAVRVLIVDDEEAITTSLTHVLTDEGYAVRIAHNGVDALAVIDAEPIDVLLCDVTMPGLDGLSLAKELRTRGLDLPIVLMSVRSDFDELPANVRYLRKPFTIDEITSAVHNALGDNHRSDTM